MSFPDPVHNLENLTAKNRVRRFSIYLTVLFSLSLVIILLPIIKVDITSQSRGIVRADKENVFLSTLIGGKVIFQNLKKNNFVRTGDTLLIISKENLQSEKKLNDSLYRTTKLFWEDFTKILKGDYKNLKTKRVRTEFDAFVAKKAELESNFQLSKLNFSRQERLFEKEVISKSEYEGYLFELKTSKQNLTTYLTSKKAEWEIEVQLLEERLNNLQNYLDKLRIDSENYILKAPVSGTLENVLGVEVGLFLNASETLGSISPNSELIVENVVSPNDIGLINKGQPVKFLFDAFNYNQWGMIEGNVIEIDKNITIENNQSYFKVRCSLNTRELKLKNGYKARITKGMTLTTRYFVTRRSLFELLFDKMEDWFNPKVINKN